MSCTDFGSGQLFTVLICLSFHFDSLGLIYHYYYYHQPHCRQLQALSEPAPQMIRLLCSFWALVGQAAMDFYLGQIGSERLQFFCFIIVELFIKGRLLRVIDRKLLLGPSRPFHGHQDRQHSHCDDHGHHDYIICELSIWGLSREILTVSYLSRIISRELSVISCQFHSHQLADLLINQNLIINNLIVVNPNALGVNISDDPVIELSDAAKCLDVCAGVMVLA